MKIDSSSIGFASTHTRSQQTTVQETLRVWVGNQRPDFEGRNTASAADAASASQVSISEAARSAVAKAVASAQDSTTDKKASDAGKTSEIEKAIEEVEQDPKTKLLINLIEALTGQKLRLFKASDLQLDKAAQLKADAATDTAKAAQPEQRQGWGVEYDRRETLHELEQTSFSAQGTIRTSDGKELQFSVSLQMSREFYSETNVSFRAGDGIAKDPLVINFDGTAAELTNSKFDFDLEGNGQTDKISFVGPNSGFLALDKNGNGTIDDGTELFGTQSGNGFADLAAYDEDGNGWIDENDRIFAKLLIWSKDASGQDIISTLAQRNIGALYLGSANTSFDLKDTQNTLHGQVRSTGIYLQEDGKAGTMQQVDLIV